MKIKLASAALALAGLAVFSAPAASAASAPPPAPPNSAGADIHVSLGTPTTCVPIPLGVIGITICF